MRERMAVVIGLNYPGTPAELRGCHNDADDWAALLEARGYSVVTVLDRQSGMGTRADILAALEALVSSVGYLGRGVVTYSGHGTFVPDLDGDEVDGFDEAWVPTDYASAGLITDDDLHAIFQRTRYGSRWATLSDSCHSGTVTRFVGRSDNLPELDARGRFLPPARFLPDQELNAVLGAVGGARVVPRGVSRPSGVLVSGCADPQVSYDAWFPESSRYRGAFTAAALDAFHDGVTWQGWHERIRTRLPSARYPQDPQLTATTAQRRQKALD